MVVRKLCYVIVVDEDDDTKSRRTDQEVAASCKNSQPNSSFWYTQAILQSMLQQVGCKVNHAFKISRRIFDILEAENLKPLGNLEFNSESKFGLPAYIGPRDFKDTKSSSSQLHEEDALNDPCASNSDNAYDVYMKQTTVTVKRARFLDVICSSLQEYRYVGPSQHADIILACRLRERKESMTILLCGTSGCGKSTLSSLLASRLGITTVVSTDSIRHMMRSFFDENDNPLLWASTYHAGEFLDPVAVAEAKRKRKDRKLSTSHWHGQAGPDQTAAVPQAVGDTGNQSLSEPGQANKMHIKRDVCDDRDAFSNRSSEKIGSKSLAIEGYKAQSEMVIDSLDRLIKSWEQRKESVIIEGVHLSLNFVMGLMKKHPSIVPFLIYIENEEKHMERFAVRAKYMTLDPSKNKYVKYIKNIRIIQDYLCKRADKHLVPKVNNTNVDRSVASIHSIIFSCLRRRETGISLYDADTNTVKVLNEEYRKQCDANSVSSKGMFRMIHKQGSLRHYMAIVNSDGSIAKAWPFSSVDRTTEPSSCSASISTVGNPIYGPVKVSEVEPVNLQFGNFGIGSWPNGYEGTSYMSSMCVSRVDRDECATNFSTTSIFSREGHEKKLTEEVAASESEEEIVQDDSDSSDGNQEFEDELGGSVAESSTRSDEDYESEAPSGFTNLFDSHNRSHKLSKCYSINPSRKAIHEARSFGRTHSLPLQSSSTGLKGRTH